MKRKTIIVLQMIKRYIGFSILLWSLSLIGMILNYVSPLVNGRIIDRGILKGNINILAFYILLLILLSVANCVLLYITSQIRVKYRYEIEKDYKNKILEHFITNNRYNIRTNSNGIGEVDTIIRSDINIFINFVSNNIQNIALAIFKVIIVLCIMIIMQPLLCLLVVLLYILMIVTNRIINRKLQVLSESVRKSHINTIQKLNEILTNIHEILFLKSDKYMLKSYNDTLKQSYFATKKSNSLVQLSVLFSEMINVFLECVVLGVGGYLICKNIMTLGAIISFIRYLSMFGEALSEITDLYTEYSSEKESIEAIFSLLTDINEKKEYDNTVCNCEDDISCVVLKDVTFEYEDGNKIFDRTCVEFSKECINYVVGKSGIGKSTLVKLILGYVKPIDGKIEIRNTYGDTLRENICFNSLISWVPQEPILFMDTIRNNMILGNDISDEKLENVCDMCAIYDDIMRLENGMDTMLSDGGRNLSVGQRHRLGIVRAVLQDKPIIMIDEGTAGLDSDTEEHIRKNLKQMCTNKLVIVITHSDKFFVDNAKVFSISNKKIVQRSMS